MNPKLNNCMIYLNVFLFTWWYCVFLFSIWQNWYLFVVTVYLYSLLNTILSNRNVWLIKIGNFPKFLVLSLISSPEWELKWAFLITFCPSSVCKLFTFSSFSPEPQGQFQPNLAQSILGWSRFKFVQMKGHPFFQGEIVTK